jgi:molybdate transport system ATP-binding protein
MHAIAGLVRPDAGRIHIGLRTVFDSAAGIDVPPHDRGVGVVFQDDRLFPHYSVEGNLRYGHDPVRQQINRSESPLDFNGVIELLSLRDLVTRRVATLSGGERQRVALGRALLANPNVLLLDEPLSSLDAGLKRQIVPYLRRVRDAAGIPMLYVSHDLTEMLAMTDHLLLMERGRLIAHGRYRELAHEHAVLDSLHELGLVNVLRATVARADAAAGIVELALDGGGAHAPLIRAAIRTPAATGEAMDVVIRAADVALAFAAVDGVSIQNQLPGRVNRVTRHAGRALAEIGLPGGQALLAEITLRAVESLTIEPGRPMWCLIKSNAIGMAGV